MARLWDTEPDIQRVPRHEPQIKRNGVSNDIG